MSQLHSNGKPASLFAYPPSDKPWRRWLLPILLVAASATALTIDGSLAQWSLHRHCPSDLRKLFQFSEPFGHGIGVLLLALAVFQLDTLRRRAVPRLLLLSLGSGLLADLLKLTVVRFRPYHVEMAAAAPGAFGDWLPLARVGAFAQSFPSGHAATAAGLALGLSALYPRGRWLFVGLAVLVACQRLESDAHYLSDVLFGAAIGATVAALCLNRGALARRFDQWELPLGTAHYPLPASHSPHSSRTTRARRPAARSSS
jgi:membrane-associated phospholipid phosphatase